MIVAILSRINPVKDRIGGNLRTWRYYRRVVRRPSCQIFRNGGSALRLDTAPVESDPG